MKKSINEYYKDLGLAPGQSVEEVEEAFKKLSLIYNPDKYQGEKVKAEEKFTLIQNARTELVEYFKHLENSRAHEDTNVLAAAQASASEGKSSSGPSLSSTTSNISKEQLIEFAEACRRGEKRTINQFFDKTVNLHGMNLSGINLNGTNFTEANLAGIDFTTAGNAERLNFTGANLSGANLSRLPSRYFELTGANLSGANLSRLSLGNKDLSNCNIQGAIVTGTDLSGANLSGCNMQGAIVTDAYLSGANFTGANLAGIDFTTAGNAERLNFTGANLSGANLSRLPSRYFELTGANLSGANLSGLNLHGQNLSTCKMRGTILIGATGFDLSAAETQGAICNIAQFINFGSKIYLDPIDANTLSLYRKNIEYLLSNNERLGITAEQRGEILTLKENFIRDFPNFSLNRSEQEDLMNSAIKAMLIKGERKESNFSEISLSQRFHPGIPELIGSYLDENVSSKPVYERNLLAISTDKFNDILAGKATEFDRLSILASTPAEKSIVAEINIYQKLAANSSSLVEGKGEEKYEKEGKASDKQVIAIDKIAANVVSSLKGVHWKKGYSTHSVKGCDLVKLAYNISDDHRGFITKKIVGKYVEQTELRNDLEGLVAKGLKNYASTISHFTEAEREEFSNKLGAKLQELTSLTDKSLLADRDFSKDSAKKNQISKIIDNHINESINKTIEPLIGIVAKRIDGQMMASEKIALENEKLKASSIASDHKAIDPVISLSPSLTITQTSQKPEATGMVAGDTRRNTALSASLTITQTAKVPETTDMLVGETKGSADLSASSSHSVLSEASDKEKVTPSAENKDYKEYKGKYDKVVKQVEDPSHRDNLKKQRASDEGKTNQR
jgi:uncharacterized protein YjbI with pentapeptide repeats